MIGENPGALNKSPVGVKGFKITQVTVYPFHQVYTDGVITLGKHTFPEERHRRYPFPPSAPSIAVFYAPVALAKSSAVFLRETRNETILKKATDYVRSTFIKEKEFTAKGVVISTWKDVVHRHAHGKLPNQVKAAL